MYRLLPIGWVAGLIFFLPLCVCVLPACMHVGPEEHVISHVTIVKQLWTIIMWVLAIKPSSSARAPSLLTSKPSLQFLYFIFKMITYYRVWTSGVRKEKGVKEMWKLWEHGVSCVNATQGTARVCEGRALMHENSRVAVTRFWQSQSLHRGLTALCKKHLHEDMCPASVQPQTTVALVTDPY